MAKSYAINEFGVIDEPVIIPPNSCTLYDGINYIVFDTYDEYIDYINKLNAQNNE